MAATKGRDVLRVAATYIGTVVGAGFASGQEILRFFAVFGRHGLWGVAMATALFIVLGVAVMDLGRRLGADSHREVMLYTCGPWLGGLMDLMVTSFLLASLAVMLAGAGAVMAQQFGLPTGAGVALTALATVFTVLLGLRGIVAANGLVVPMLTAFVLAVTLGALWRQGTAVPFDPQRLDLAAAPHWALSAVLYVAYNLVLAVAVLAPLGKAVGDARVLWRGGVLGGAGLGLLALLIKLAVGRNLSDLAGSEVPLLSIAQAYAPSFQALYALVLWSEIYTTAIGSLYGFASRLTLWRRWDYPLLVLGSAAVAAWGSQAGFSHLVATLYPLYGYASLAFVVALMWKVLQRSLLRA
ncbi:MAG: hypothetical protein M1602_01870 [Firmicutes bacterium]|nr:hypothetical protein [Bacillota bacterium]